MSNRHAIFWTSASKYFKGVCKTFVREAKNFDRCYLTQSIKKYMFGCSAEWSIVAGLNGKKKPAVRVELVFKSSNGELNKRAFEQIEKNKKAIEKQFEASLNWDYKEGRKKQIIGFEAPWDSREDESVKVIAGWLEKNMVKLQKAISDHCCFIK